MSSPTYRIYIENKRPDLFKAREYSSAAKKMLPINNDTSEYFSLDLPAEHFKATKDFVDIDASLKSWAGSGNVLLKPSWDGDKPFFPVQLWKNGNRILPSANIEMDLLRAAETSNLKVLKYDEPSSSNAEPTKRSTAQDRSKTEAAIVDDCLDCKSTISPQLKSVIDFGNELLKATSKNLEKHFTPKAEPKKTGLNEECLDSIKPLDEVFPRAHKAWWSNKNWCVNWIRKNACQNSVWRKKTVEQKYKSLIALAEPISADFKIDSRLLACIGAKETSTLEPSIRTEAACGQRVRNGKKVPNAGYSTASGLFQITQTLMGDIMRRKVRISVKNHPEAMRVFKKHMTDEEIDYLSNMSLSDNKECKDHEKCRDIMLRMWYAMPQDLELQITLSLIGLETTGSVANYHGGTDQRLIQDYASRVNSCHSCMLSNKAEEEHECLVLAASAQGHVESYNDRKLSNKTKRSFEDLEKNNSNKQKQYCNNKDNKC